jgi:hypothetical protein
VSLLLVGTHFSYAFLYTVMAQKHPQWEGQHGLVVELIANLWNHENGKIAYNNLRY